MVLSKDEELALCTPVKTAMMLLVVLYHSCVMWGGSWFAEPAVQSPALGVFAQWLNTFHVPVFVFMSGYLYAYLKGETDRYDSMSVTMAKKAKRLLVPYVFACVVWVVPFWVLFNGSDQVVDKYLLAGSPSQLWFLVMLFVVFLLFELLWKLLGKRMLSVSTGTVACAVVLYCGGCILGRVLPVNVGQIASACRFSCIFWAGMAFRALPVQGFWRVPAIVPLVAHSLLFSLALFVGAQKGAAFSVASIALWPVVRLAGIAMAVAVLGRVFIWFGVTESHRGGVLTKSCFGVYLFHQQIVQVVISLLNVPSIPPLALALACFGISLSISLLITVALRRFKLTRVLVGE